MIQNKILKSVQSGLKHVPGPVVAVMKTKPVMVGCGVVGAALTAYSTGNASGSQAIAGTAIGLGVVAVQSIPVGKILSAAITLGRRK